MLLRWRLLLFPEATAMIGFFAPKEENAQKTGRKMVFQKGIVAWKMTISQMFPFMIF